MEVVFCTCSVHVDVHTQTPCLAGRFPVLCRAVQQLPGVVLIHLLFSCLNINKANFLFFSAYFIKVLYAKKYLIDILQCCQLLIFGLLAFLYHLYSSKRLSCSTIQTPHSNVVGFFFTSYLD